jgi:hypothetical protein
MSTFAVDGSAYVNGFLRGRLLPRHEVEKKLIAKISFSLFTFLPKCIK